MICKFEQYQAPVDYATGLALQQERIAQRKAGMISDALLLLEHPHVYTLGRNARRENVLVSPQFLRSRGAEVFETDRGGDVTYHGPGQLVGYPIIDLAQHRRDIAWYMRSLEEVLIRVAADYGIEAERLPGAAGVWVGNKKLAAMGVHISRWVTSHGFALNVNTDLSYFQWIVPCGLSDKGVTSLSKLLGHETAMNQAAERVIEHFGGVFDLKVQRTLISPKSAVLSEEPADEEMATASLKINTDGLKDRWTEGRND
jgi:lipoyl(octanoyl) transferase